MYEEQYLKSISKVTENDFARAFTDNIDQSDVQLVADYLRKVELNEEVVQKVVMFMYDNQNIWTRQAVDIINWHNTEEKNE